MANLTSRHVAIYSQLFPCPGEMKPFKADSSTHVHLTKLSTVKVAQVASFC